ncbi:MAG: hypothetical protein LIO86_14815 [Lachnospiraceae bacterium]|nr:hypothetical protein [Lachnospiraceae bacterium]
MNQDEFNALSSSLLSLKDVLAKNVPSADALCEAASAAMANLSSKTFDVSSLVMSFTQKYQDTKMPSVSPALISAAQVAAESIAKQMSMQEEMSLHISDSLSSLIAVSEKNTESIRNLAQSLEESLRMPAFTDSLSNDDSICIPGSLADALAEADDSLELPAKSADGIVRIDKTRPDLFWKILSLVLTVLMMLQTAYYNTSNSALSEQQHEELMLEECQQTEYLHQMCDMLSDQLSEEPTTMPEQE